MVDLVRALEELSNAFGVAGHEDQVRDILRRYIEPYVDEIRVDKLGNLICTKRREGKVKIMLAAHMDEVGLIVKAIEKEGVIRFAPIGGLDPRVLVSQRVIIHTREGKRIPGVISSIPPHIQEPQEREKAFKLEHLFIDIGATSDKEVEELGIRIGDPISFDVKFTRLHGKYVSGKAFDDRIGCAELIAIAEHLDEVDAEIYLVGTVQEEVGLRGAATAAYGIYPDYAIALDVTVGGGIPGVKITQVTARPGQGPVVTVADGGLLAHPKVLRALIEAARRLGIKYQLETFLPYGGTTDAARITLTREGVPSGVITVATRYIHAPVSVANLEDMENAVRLAIETCKELSRG
ncbi:MAG: M42 family peptidase [Thermoprotei archaeon]|nr:MAG: M42 family peptidase [Thermoprotei archaeon]